MNEEEQAQKKLLEALSQLHHELFLLTWIIENPGEADLEAWWQLETDKGC